MTSSGVPQLISNTTDTAYGSLHYLGPQARGSHEVLLMVHGFGSSSAVWGPLIEAAAALGLLDGRDVIAVDLPGFGQSQNRLGQLDSAQVGRELLSLAGGLGYTRVRLVGHSMGGFLALDMAARYPGQIVSIHIVSGSYFTMLSMVKHPLRTLARTPQVALFYWLQVYLSHHNALARFLNRWLARRPAARAGTKPHYLLGGPNFRFGAANGVGYDAQKLWGGIKIPVYGAFGNRDRIVPVGDMRRLQTIIPHARLTLISGTGHSSLVEKPSETAAALFGSLK